MSRQFATWFKEGYGEARGQARAFFSICALAFLLLFSYGISRPSVESLFLSEYGREGLPYAWLAVSVAALSTVFLFSVLNRRFELTRIGAGMALASALVLAFLLLVEHLPHRYFILYVWKDIHLVLLIEIFWSFANSTFPLKTARWVYGMFCAAGQMGGLIAEASVGIWAKRFGTETVLGWVVPLLMVASIAIYRLAWIKRIPPPPKIEQHHHLGAWRQSFRTLSRSDYLMLMVALIAVTQLVINLIDFQFNGVMAESFPDKDLRTAAIGQVYAAISAIAFVLQFSAGFILKAFGVGRVLIAIPLLLLASVGAHALLPLALMMALTKITSKSLDYSLFRAAKETLYIPLSQAEKTEGKAVVDIMTYRMAKGLASVILLALGTLLTPYFLTTLNLLLLCLWGILITAIIKRYERRMNAEHNEVS